MYEYLKKYYRDLEDLEKDEDVIGARKKVKDARMMESIGSIAGDLQKLGVLGGVAPKSSLPEYFARDRSTKEKDLSELLGRKKMDQRDILGRLDALRGIEREEKADKRYEEELGYRREQREKEEERRRKQDEISEERRRLDEEFKREAMDLKKSELEKRASERKEKESKPTSEEQKLRKILSEEESRFGILNRNLDELEKLVKKHGTVDFFGPEKGMKESKLYQMAIDFAKVVDPESVAREGEVESARKYLLGIDWSSPSTALKLIDNFRKDLEARRGSKHQSLERYYGDMYKKYAPEKEEKQEVYSAPVMTRRDRSDFVAKAKATEVGDEFEFNGKRYMVTGIDKDGDKEIAEL